MIIISFIDLDLDSRPYKLSEHTAVLDSERVPLSVATPFRVDLDLDYNEMKDIIYYGKIMVEAPVGIPALVSVDPILSHQTRYNLKIL